VTKFLLSLVLYFYHIWLQHLSKVFESQSSHCLLLHPSCHFGFLQNSCIFLLQLFSLFSMYSSSFFFNIYFVLEFWNYVFHFFLSAWFKELFVSRVSVSFFFLRLSMSLLSYYFTLYTIFFIWFISFLLFSSFCCLLVSSLSSFSSFATSWVF
jgi:hypothetical protein